MWAVDGDTLYNARERTDAKEAWLEFQNENENQEKRWILFHSLRLLMATKNDNLCAFAKFTISVTSHDRSRFLDIHVTIHSAHCVSSSRMFVRFVSQLVGGHVRCWFQSLKLPFTCRARRHDRQLPSSERDSEMGCVLFPTTSTTHPQL